jgi:hypothetical protein
LDAWWQVKGSRVFRLRLKMGRSAMTLPDTLHHRGLTGRFHRFPMQTKD